MLSPESSVAFQIGSFSVKFYSITMFFAIVTGIYTMLFVAKKFFKDIPLSTLIDMCPIVIIGAFIGARLYYVALDWTYFAKNSIEILAVYHGGISIHGAILGGFLSGAVYLNKHKLNILKYADIFAFGLPAGQIVGRLGNYFNVEAFGKPCEYSDILCMQVPTLKRPLEYIDTVAFHPTFLYEMVWSAVVLTVLISFIPKLKTQPQGSIFLWYLILYSIGRLIIEPIRLDSALSIGSIHFAQIASGVIILGSVIALIVLYKKAKAQPSQ